MTTRRPNLLISCRATTDFVCRSIWRGIQDAILSFADQAGHDSIDADVERPQLSCKPACESDNSGFASGIVHGLVPVDKHHARNVDDFAVTGPLHVRRNRAGA